MIKGVQQIFQGERVILTYVDEEYRFLHADISEAMNVTTAVTTK